MQLDTQDYLKKALLDTQERIRDFQSYSRKVCDTELSQFFSEYALSEAEHAQKLQKYIESVKS